MTPDYQTPSTPPPHAGVAAKLIIAWAIVAVPAIWGVAQTVNKSLALFTAPAPAATTAPILPASTAPADGAATLPAPPH